MDLFQTLGLGDKPSEENAVCYALYPGELGWVCHHLQ